MKKLFAVLALTAGITFSAQAQYENTTIQVGQTAPNLSFSTPSGKTLKLSEVNKNSIVLVDFWASWCGPCRRANPGLVAMYNQFKDKKFKGAKDGLKIYSVSLDQNKEAWVAAISKDNLSWDTHVSDLGGWQSEAARTYGIQYIPQAFLLDEKGKVLGKYMTAEEARADIEKLTK